jgi:asparagine synthase (glutamine-hydrolysing)
MTGNYGGEVLRRVRAFKPMEPTLGLFQPEFLPYIHTAGDTYARLLQGNPLSFAVFRQAPWHHYGLLGLEQTQLTLRTPYLDNEFVGMVFRAPESFRASSEVSLRLIADGNPALCRIRTDRGLGGDRELLLAAVSRAFIGFTVKAEYAYDYGMPNWIARIDHLLSSFHLERLFLGRHKFYHFRVWYRDFLSEYVREMLLDPRTLSRPYLQRSTLEAVVRSHLKGDRNYTTAIHQVLTLELIHRLFLDPR